MTAEEPMIQTQKLTKSFGSFQALRGLDLTVSPGEVHGFLGPNGAGKSTTIRVLLGLLKADGGQVRLLGADPWKDAVALHSRLAYVPGDVSLWPGMSGGEAIDLLGSMRGGLNEQRRRELIDRFELDPTKRGRQYSKGNRQKVALIAALASDVDLLILDEPTSGLDPLMENVFQETVAEAKDRGVTVLLSSHIMSEIENLADRLSIIRDGEIIRSGSLEELRGNATTTVHASLRSSLDPATLNRLGASSKDGKHYELSLDSQRVGDAIVTFLSVSSIIAFDAVFPEQADRLGLNAAISSNPALGLVFGPVETLMSADGFNAWRSMALGGFMTALCAIFAVSKSARAQENSGQAELLASGVLGRSARLLVAVLMGLLFSLVIGLVAGGRNFWHPLCATRFCLRG